jgi:hypothetical protein
MTPPHLYKCDRRERSDRRQFSYYIHIPERRSGGDRRSMEDRRDVFGNKQENINQRRRCNDKHILQQ